jgi:hypothetical protein
MNSWPALWHHFTATMAQQPVAVVLAVWVGMALVLVMALEGLLLNLAPGCVFQRYLEKMPDRKKKSSAPIPAPAPAVEPAPAPVLALAVPAPPAEIPAPEPPAEPVAKKRSHKNRNRKKPAPGPKSARAVTAWRRVAPPSERLSRGTPRLLTPKN